MSADNADVADFVVVLVYIQEAHVTNGCTVPVDQRQSDNHRSSIADRVAAVSKLIPSPLPSNMTIVTDPLSNNAMRAYGAVPERLYIVRNGVVAYQGHAGPFRFYRDVADVANWLKRYRDSLGLTNDKNGAGQVRRRETLPKTSDRDCSS